MVGVTKLTFIKYCVKLFKDNVEPMLKKLNRNAAGPRKNISPDAIGKRRANLVMNKETLEKALSPGGDGDHFLTKLDVLRKRHGI